MAPAATLPVQHWKGISTSKELCSQSTACPSPHPTATKTTLSAEKENKAVPNIWGKDGNRYAALGRNAQNPGAVLVDVRLCCVKEICLAKTLDLIINKQQQQQQKAKPKIK